MFIGHFGIAFAATPVAGGTSLGTLFLAAQFVDLLWPGFLLLGIETVEVTPGATRLTPLEFTHYPISHSLLGVVIWAVLFAGTCFAIRRNVTVAVVCGALVVSHWILDALTHKPDLPLAPGATIKIGLGLWNHPGPVIAVEAGIFILGVCLYLRSTRAVDRTGSVALWSLIGTLVLIHAGNLLAVPRRPAARRWRGYHRRSGCSLPGDTGWTATGNPGFPPQERPDRPCRRLITGCRVTPAPVAACVHGCLPTRAAMTGNPVSWPIGRSIPTRPRGGANMNWNTLSAVADLFAALFVGVSVVYLALQIRSSTRATHSQTYHLATSALAEMASIVGTEKERARIFRQGMEDPGVLTEDEYTQFGYLGISLFRRFENVFFQYESGMIDEDFWIGHRDNILWFFHRPGMQFWWKDRKFAFSKSFREFLDSTSSDEIFSPDSRRL